MQTIHSVVLNIRLFFIILISTFIISCGEGEQQNNAAEIQPIMIQGTAAKGALFNALVSLYELDEFGEQIGESPIAQTTTNAFGQFTFELTPFETPLLIITSGGEFIDESDQEPDINLKRRIIFAQNEGLVSVLTPGDSTAAITIATSALVIKSKLETFGNSFFATLQNNRDNAAAAFGFDIFSVQPSDTITPDVTDSEQAKQYALVLGGLANVVNRVSLELGYPNPNFHIVQAVVQDLSDGVIDGKMQNELLETINFSGALQSIPNDILLNNEINRFRNNNFSNFSQTSLIEVNESLLAEDNADNQIPQVNAGNDITLISGAESTISATASDTDGTITHVLWQQTSGNEIILLNPESLDLNIAVPFVEQTQTAELQVTVTDNNGATNSDSITITIVTTDENQLPLVDAGEDQSVTENTQVNLSGTASDPDGNITTVLWTQSSGSPVSITNPDQLNMSFTAPSVTAPTSLSFTLTATDNSNASANDTIVVTVNPAGNQPPTANAGTDQTVDAQVSVSLIGTGTDSDGTIVSFSWNQTSGPSVTLTSPNSATTSFTSPNVESTTVLTFELTVTDDDGATDTDQISITVVPGNQHPTANAGTDQTVDAQVSVSLIGTGTDSDGTIVSFSWNQTSGPSVTLTSPNSATTSFTSPNVESTTVLTFELTVTDDDGATDTDQISITVVPGNQHPTANAGTDQTVDAQVSVSLIGTGTDSDGTIVSFSWNQTSGPSVTLTSPNSATTSFTSPNVESTTVLTFELTVTDDDGATDTDQISITVVPGNQHPTANAGPDQTVLSEANVNLTGTGTDTDGTITSFSWSQTSGALVSLLNANTANANFTAPSVTSTSIILEFTLTVTDDDNATAVDTVTITVDPSTNQPPSVNAGPDQSVTSASTVALSGSASDPDGSIMSYLWQQVSGSTVSITDDNMADASFRAPSVTSSETFTFSLTVTDNEAATATDTVAVTVTPLSNGTLLWTFQTSGPVLSSPALDPSGNILVGSDDFCLYSISPQGVENWNFAAASFVRSSPMYTSSGNIYFGSSDTKLYAVNSSGSLIWSFATPNAIISSPALMQNGNIFISSVNRIYSVNNQGGEDWHFTIPSGETSPAAIATDGTIFVGSGDSFTYGFPPQPPTFPVNWEYNVGQPVHGAAAIGSDGAIFIGADDNKVYAFDPIADNDSILTLRWSFATSGKVKATPALGSNNILYIGSEDNNFYAIDISSGTVVWSFPTAGSIVSSAAIASDGTIIFGSGDGNIYALNANGTLKWKLQTSNIIVSSPVIAPDGTIYIGSADGKVYAVYDNNGGLSTNAPWPMFRFNPTHTGNIN